jgi:hypothetical protein
MGRTEGIAHSNRTASVRGENGYSLVMTTRQNDGEWRRKCNQPRVKRHTKNGRKETVEGVFGDIKQNLKFREFLTRGVENVRTE